MRLRGNANWPLLHEQVSLEDAAFMKSVDIEYAGKQRVWWQLLGEEIVTTSL
jgi:hypothetical protein